MHFKFSASEVVILEGEVASDISIQKIGLNEPNITVSVTNNIPEEDGGQSVTNDLLFKSCLIVILCRTSFRRLCFYKLNFGSVIKYRDLQ